MPAQLALLFRFVQARNTADHAIDTLVHSVLVVLFQSHPRLPKVNTSETWRVNRPQCVEGPALVCGAGPLRAERRPRFCDALTVL